jgi:hypothetical protein
MLHCEGKEYTVHYKRRCKINVLISYGHKKNKEIHIRMHKVFIHILTHLRIQCVACIVSRELSCKLGAK